MEKNFKYSRLLSVYGSLLTKKQYETMQYYYDEDLSLGEIAENMGISRQGVRDFIKRGEELLTDLDSKLNLLKKLSLVNEIEKSAEDIRLVNARYSAIGEIDRLAEKISEAARFIEEN